MFIAQLACRISSTCVVYLAFARREIRQTAKAVGDERHISSTETDDGRRARERRERAPSPVMHRTKLSRRSLLRHCVAPLTLTLTLSLLSGVHGRSDKIRAREQNNRSRRVARERVGEREEEKKSLNINGVGRQ